MTTRTLPLIPGAEQGIAQVRLRETIARSAVAAAAAAAYAACAGALSTTGHPAGHTADSAYASEALSDAVDIATAWHSGADAAALAALATGAQVRAAETEIDALRSTYSALVSGAVGSGAVTAALSHLRAVGEYWAAASSAGASWPLPRWPLPALEVGRSLAVVLALANIASDDGEIHDDSAAEAHIRDVFAVVQLWVDSLSGASVARQRGSASALACALRTFGAFAERQGALALSAELVDTAELVDNTTETVMLATRRDS